MFNIHQFANSDVAAYIMVFLGLRFAYTSFGTEKHSILFFSTTSFILGLLIFIMRNFSFINQSSVLVPALIFTISAGFLVLFVNKPKNRLFFTIFLLFLMIGVFFVITFGKWSFGNFIYAFPEIFSKYWLIFIICVIIILTFRREEE